MNWNLPGVSVPAPAQGALPGAGVQGAVLPPVRDVTMYAASLRENGAYPWAESGRWRTDSQALTHVVQSYFNRSKHFVDRGADFSARLDFFLTNEPNYPSAIGAIQDRGGAFIGVGRNVPVTYAAWQGASHAYVVDRKAVIPLGFTPVYGAWLCMARDRLEFLSLILGRPLTRGTESDNLSAEAVVDMVRSMPFDESFARAVISSLTAAFAKSSRMPGPASLKVELREWMARLNRAFSQRRSSGFDEANPASALLRQDSSGRGGVLSSELSFTRQRELFIEDRITGVAGDMIAGGLDAIEADIKRTGQRLGALYISNIEDVLLFNYLFDEKRPDESSRSERVQRYYDFYSRLSLLPDAEEAVAVSAKKRRFTSVDSLARYVRRSMPLDIGIDEATNAAKDFYRFRVDVEAMKGLPPMERMERISKSCRNRHRFSVGLSVLRSLCNGAFANRESFEEILSGEFRRRGMHTSGWWMRMFLDNLEELGLVSKGVSLF